MVNDPSPENTEKSDHEHDQDQQNQDQNTGTSGATEVIPAHQDEDTHSGNV